MRTTIARKLTFAILAAALMAAAAVPGGAQSMNNESSTTVDQQFVTQAMTGGGKEIDEAQAEIKASNDPSVKLYAQTILRDHTNANGQIAAVARNLNLTFPPAHVQMTSDNGNPGGSGSTGASGTAATGNTVAPMSSKAYMQHEVQEHQQAIALFENEAKNGGSQQLRTIAAQTLPVLKAHLAMAQQYVNTGRVTPESTPAPPGQ